LLWLVMIALAAMDGKHFLVCQMARKTCEIAR
jgi:hypothetical protein